MKPVSEYTFVNADDGLRQAAISLLQENDLPVADLDSSKDLFVLLKNTELIGTGGLEFFGNCALIRSVSVKMNLQGKGLGGIINNELEMISKQKGVDCLYLLTTTAKEFFSKKGFNVIDRDAVPESIKNTSEFSSLCPSTAVVMKKNLY